MVIPLVKYLIKVFLIASKVASNIEASNNGMTQKEIVDNSVVPKQAWGNEVSCFFKQCIFN